MPDPAAKRSPYSFTLRRALWWFVALSVVFAGARWAYVRIYIQNWAVEELKTLGVTTLDSGHYIPMSQGGPGYKGDMHDHAPYAVVAAQLHVPFASDEDAKRANQLLRQLPYLEDVSAHTPRERRTQWQNAKAVADWHFAMAIDGLPVSGVDFNRDLSGMQTLQLLRASRSLRAMMFHPGISSAEDLELICENPNLRRLSVNDQGLTPEHLHVLAKARQIKQLFLSNPPIDRLQELGGLADCDLRLYSRRFTDQDLDQVVAKLPNLRQLGLSFNEQITDSGVRSLKQATSLEKLSLQECSNITDAGIEPLKDLSHLVEVNLDHTQVTEEGVIAFCRNKRFNYVHVWQGLDIPRMRAACPNANILPGPDEKPQNKWLQQKTRDPPDDDGESLQ